MPFACMFDIAKVKWQIHSRPSVCRRHSAYFNPCDTMHNGNGTHYVYVLLVSSCCCRCFVSFCVVFFAIIWNLFAGSGADCQDEKGRYKLDSMEEKDITWKNSCTFHTIHCHVLDTSCEWIFFFLAYTHSLTLTRSSCSTDYIYRILKKLCDFYVL